MEETTAKRLFSTFKHGNQLAFIIEPICEKDERGNDTKICGPHADTPNELGRMFEDLQRVLSKEENGFKVQIFGLPRHLYASLKKRYRKPHKEKKKPCAVTIPELKQHCNRPIIKNKEFNEAILKVSELIDRHPDYTIEYLQQQVLMMKR